MKGAPVRACPVRCARRRAPAPPGSGGAGGARGRGTYPHSHEPVPEHDPREQEHERLVAAEEHGGVRGVDFLDRVQVQVVGERPEHAEGRRPRAEGPRSEARVAEEAAALPGNRRGAVTTATGEGGYPRQQERGGHPPATGGRSPRQQEGAVTPATGEGGHPGNRRGAVTPGRGSRTSSRTAFPDGGLKAHWGRGRIFLALIDYRLSTCF